MQRQIINQEFSLSPVSHGYWRAANWGYTSDELYELLLKLLEMGVTTFDHANIYGGGQAEELFGKVLKAHPELRNQMEIVTKCGIVKNLSDTTGLTPSYYNTTYAHVVSSVEESLQRLQTDYIDILLIHRVDHLMDYKETAKAFTDLRASGKVRYFGVSNFLAPQLEAMKKEFPDLILNQIQVSVDHLEHFKNGTLEKIQALDLKAMAYSPLGGAKIFTQENYHPRLYEALERIRVVHNASSIDQIMYAWIMKHPLQIMPIVGSSKLERVQIAVEALDIQLTNQEFYELYAHSQLEPLP